MLPGWTPTDTYFSLTNVCVSCMALNVRHPQFPKRCVKHQGPFHYYAPFTDWSLYWKGCSVRAIRESLNMFQLTIRGQTMKENTRQHFAYRYQHENFTSLIFLIRSKSVKWSSFDVTRLIYRSGFRMFWYSNKAGMFVGRKFT